MVPAASLTDVVQAGSVGVRGGPAEPGELARDATATIVRRLAALCVRLCQVRCRRLLRLPGDRDDVRGLPGLAALEAPPLRGGRR